MLTASIIRAIIIALMMEAVIVSETLVGRPSVTPSK
jgi:hypothetical protein